MRSGVLTEYSTTSPANRRERLSLNNGLKCRKPVFMRVSGICFIKWLQFGSICWRDKGCESTDGEIKA